MAIPPRYSWGVHEVAARWGCMPADIIGWAVAEMLEVITTIPPCRTPEGEHCGIVAVSPAALLPMFRRDGTGTQSKMIHRVAAPGSRAYRTITEPGEGIEVHAADIMVTNAEVERFEEEHGLRRAVPKGGKNPSWDWEAFWRAVIRRVHNYGLPETQRELAIEMQEWFMRRSPNGDAPDLRTITRKMSEMWRDLREEDDRDILDEAEP